MSQRQDAVWVRVVGTNRYRVEVEKAPSPVAMGIKYKCKCFM